MNATSYDVKVWQIQTRYKTVQGKKVPARYVVRWTVDGKRFEASYRNLAQADSFRSELLSAARKGEPFDTETGRPVSHARKAPQMSWFEFACDYAGMKWEGSSPKHRSSIADSLIVITIAMLRAASGRPERKLLSRALRRAFNKNKRDERHGEDVATALAWVQRHSRPVGDLAKPDVLRSVLATLDCKQNGDRAAHDTIRIRRTILSNAADYAADEKKLLSSNPIREIKVRKHKAVLKQVDKRSVVNPLQARTVLRAVLENSPRLYAFFATMYFAALRPEEALNLRKPNLSLPESGWGDIHLEKASPEVGEEWTDSGERGEERSLKHRDDNTGRTVPCSDELTEILHWHLATYGTTPDGRLFRGARGGHLASTVYGRAWARARQAAFTPEVVASPLAKRPYDLRHAAVSTWLNATGDPVRVAEWAGHSVSVLLRVYAKCLDGGQRQAIEQVAQRLKGL